MSRKTVWIFMLLSTAVLASEDVEPGTMLLQPGLWHGEEVSAESGDGWWGLFPVADGYALTETSIVVTREHDGIVDAEGEATGKRIHVAQQPEPLFLIKGITGLRGGPVQTTFEGRRFIYPGESVVIGTHHGGFTSLEALGRAEDAEFGTVLKDYAIRFRNSEGVRQEIRRFEQLDVDGQPALLWAGDLDRDDKPDMMFDLTDHYNVRVLTLFLSSHANDGGLARAVAVWVTTGC